MCCKSFWTKIVPFGLALLMSIFITDIFQETSYTEKKLVVPAVKTEENYSGNRIGTNYEIESNPEILVRSGTNSLKFLEKPLARYTNLARENNITGTVRLKVVFLANGKIGEIKVIQGLEFGLTNKAVESAKQIKFEPATRNGKPINVVKIIEYNFNIY
jgi:TonB family protein